MLIGFMGRAQYKVHARTILNIDSRYLAVLQFLTMSERNWKHVYVELPNVPLLGGGSSSNSPGSSSRYRTPDEWPSSDGNMPQGPFAPTNSGILPPSHDRSCKRSRPPSLEPDGTRRWK